MHLPLILDKIVALATLVSPRETFIDQLPIKPIHKNTNARCAVCLLVNGGRDSSDREVL